MSGSFPSGLTTKIHALVDKKGRPIKLKLTAGQASDVASAPELIADLSEDAMLIADKGYDANALREAVAERGAWPNSGGATRRSVGPNVGPLLSDLPNSLKTCHKVCQIGAQERTRTFTACTAGT